MPRVTPRPRRETSSATLLLRPLFRYSSSREAHVLRLVGNRVGPVLRERSGPEPAKPFAAHHHR